MTLKVDVDEGAARWSEIVAEVEAGHEVLISRGPIPVATVKREQSQRSTTQEAIDAIMAARKDSAPTTADEILAWRDEGRRY